MTKFSTLIYELLWISYSIYGNMCLVMIHGELWYFFINVVITSISENYDLNHENIIIV